MGFTIKENTKIAVKEEVTEGTYIAPAAADFVEAKSDNVSINQTQELLEQSLLGSGLTKKKSQLGLTAVEASLTAMLKASGTEGADPEWGILCESALGGKRSSATLTSDSSGENTTTDIHLPDTSSIKKHDIVMAKVAGDYHISPVASVDSDKIVLEIANDTAFPDSVQIAAFTTYTPANSGHPSFSVTKYVEDAVKETAWGCKTKTLSVSNFITGQNAEIAFTAEGLDGNTELEAPAVTPTYDSAETPVILKACIYKDGAEIDVNEFTLNIENTLSFITTTCEGKKSSRVVSRAVSGTINPYKQDNSIAEFTNFKNNDTFSLFVQCHNPTSTDGEKEEVIGFWLPKCQITEMAEADQEGNLTNAITFQAVGDSDNGEVFITVI